MKLLPFEITGELVALAPRTREYVSPHFEILIPLGKDATASFVTCEDGIEWLRENGYLDITDEGQTD